MTRKALIEREKKRRLLTAKYAARRKELKKVVSSPYSSFEEKMAAQEQLQALPRDSSPVRQRNRCALTGRGRGFLRRFGLSRITFREKASMGEIPGVHKASW